MIIGINGKIGSGKDTVGKIIQYLIYFNKTGIQLSLGVNEHIVKQLLNPSYGYYEVDIIQRTGWEDKKFAGKLKTVASLLTGIPVEKFEDQEFKKLNMSNSWNKLQQSGRNKVVLPITYRQFLQELGTEAMRDGLHTNVWVNALMADYTPVCNKFESKMLQTGGNYTSSICSDCNCFPNWIITDMRFENELEAVIIKGGITIRVVRPGTVVGNHPSEVALDGFIMHYEIINDGTLEDLVEKVKEILIKENII